jgi:uncharacterized protein YdeI (YjbR/CyaY-like superfamily)
MFLETNNEGGKMEERLLFADRDAFRQWLIRHHGDNKGIWLVFGKTAKVKSLKAGEALDEALCFGWIDGLIKSVDEDRYLKKFTPRRQGSNWSARNKKIVESLIKNGKMTERGLKAIEEAKKHSTWDKPEREPVLDEHIETLIRDINGIEPALSNYLKMPLYVRKTYAAFYHDAKKEETRIRRLQNIIERLNQNKKPME